MPFSPVYDLHPLINPVVRDGSVCGMRGNPMRPARQQQETVQDDN
ncbi:hypothetical protein [Pantoea ananatis]|nr:hypothetical protein [Pantoea ananatis]